MKFTNEAAIWDLHIHTNKCPKGMGGEFHSKYFNDTEGFINELISVLNNTTNSKVEMISFTDHNQISLEVYQKFYEKETNIELLPGVEIDCYIDENKRETKHIIFYFNCPKENIVKLSIEVNDILEKSRSKEPEYLDIMTLINKFREKGLVFAISPHAFKQEKRGIDFRWNDEDLTPMEAEKFTDQFFIFWESSGLSTIQKAKEFLESFNMQEKISIISFSDSNNFEKLRSYLSNPHQYFKSLPSFRGLSMAASDINRIKENCMPFPKSRDTNLIKKIIFDGEEIELSRQLNAIIGGRGSGKSILLDAIAYNFDKDAIKLAKRKQFIEKFPITIKNYNDSNLSTNFDFDYFNQAYVNELFSDNNFSKKLKDKFQDSFSKIEDINVSGIKIENFTNFKKHLVPKDESSTENLESFEKDYVIISNDGLSIQLTEEEKKTSAIGDEAINYDVEINKLETYFSELPNPIKSKTGIEHLRGLLKLMLVDEIYSHNCSVIENIEAHNIVIDNYINAKENKTNQATIKTKIKTNIRNQFEYLTRDFKSRNALINAYYKMSKNFKAYYSSFNVENGETKNRFVFSKELHIQSPIDYMFNVMSDNVDGRKKQFNKENLHEVCWLYINGSITNYLKESTSINNITKKLEEFDLEYSTEFNIYFYEDGSLKNIVEQSPGTQTNVLMEYIVYKETTKPLLIDQPEDNIDNKTIYDKLTKWFSNLKNKRQIIVVTHDANIVINADAENIIIAEQKSAEKFDYHYGALEYGTIIEEASLILDGGKKAVQRRLKKYDS